MAENIFICTGMIMFNNSDSKTKAIAQVTVNGEFVIKGIRVFEGANGAYAMMPSKLVDGEYQSIIYPITADARHELLDVVIRTYNNMRMIEMERLPPAASVPTPSEISEPSEPSDIFVTLNKNNGRVKAVGQAVINNSIVITDIRVASYKDAGGNEKLFVGMPSYKNAANEFKDLVYITSPIFRDRLHNAVMSVYEKMLETEYLGLSYRDLRKGGEVTKIDSLSTDFARRLAAKLDEVGIPFSAQINGDPAIYVLKQDIDLAADVRTALTRKLVLSTA